MSDEQPEGNEFVEREGEDLAERAMRRLREQGEYAAGKYGVEHSWLDFPQHGLIAMGEHKEHVRALVGQSPEADSIEFLEIAEQHDLHHARRDKVDFEVRQEALRIARWRLDESVARKEVWMETTNLVEGLAGAVKDKDWPMVRTLVREDGKALVSGLRGYAGIIRQRRRKT